MRARIQKPIGLTGQSNIVIKIMPFRLGGHATEGDGFAIPRLAEQNLPGVVWPKQHLSAVYLDTAAR